MAVKKTSKKNVDDLPLKKESGVYSKHIGLFILSVSESGVNLDFSDNNVRDYLNNLYEKSLKDLGGLFYSKVEIEINKKGSLQVNQQTLDLLSGIFVSCLNSLPFHLRSLLGKHQL